MKPQEVEDISQTIKMIEDSLECAQKAAQESTVLDPGLDNDACFSQCRFHLDAGKALLAYLIYQYFHDPGKDEITPASL